MSERAPTALRAEAGRQSKADRAFAALADGGKVTMPLAKTFWSPRYGMVTDRFGIGWMVIVLAEPPK